MTRSRRDFLKTTIIAGAAVAVDGVSTFAHAAQQSPSAAPVGTSQSTAMEKPVGYTAGIGVYPGEPSENFDPILVPDTSGTYRNLALLRPAIHSRRYDYNLPAQLVTDG